MIRSCGARLACAVLWSALVVACDERFAFDVIDVGGMNAGDSGGAPSAMSAAGAVSGGTANATGGAAGTGGSITAAGQPAMMSPPDAGLGGAGAAAGAGGSGGAPGEPLMCHENCELPSLRCDPRSGQCVECLDDDDCPALGLARCDRAAHRCVECGVDQDCGRGFACEPNARRCVKTCAVAVDCGDAQLTCDDTRGVCQACVSDDDCTGSDDGALCAPGGSSCVECVTDAQCAEPTPHCDFVLDRCVACRDSQDCARDEVCDPELHLCSDP